jgi:hypothetical protein
MMTPDEVSAWLYDALVGTRIDVIRISEQMAEWACRWGSVRLFVDESIIVVRLGEGAEVRVVVKNGKAKVRAVIARFAMLVSQGGETENLYAGRGEIAGAINGDASLLAVEFENTSANQYVVVERVSLMHPLI